jgi:hypothetical protein
VFGWTTLLRTCVAVASNVAFASCASDRLDETREDTDPLGGADEACPDSHPNLAGAMSAQEICALYQAQDANYNRFGTDEADWVVCMVQPTTTADALSDAALARACRPGTPGRVWADDLRTAVCEGRLTVDWKAAETCVHSSRQLRGAGPSFGVVGTDDWLAVKGACASFFSGAQHEGEECKDAWDCAEGLGCYTDDRWTPGSVTCMAPAGLGAMCDASFHPCREDLMCSDSGTCVALKSAGAGCSDHAECVSGFCTGFPTTCAPVMEPTVRQLGDTCVPCSSFSSNEEACRANADCAYDAFNGGCLALEPCDGYCVGCRRADATAEYSCAVLGGEGAFCETWYDCVLDLGCIEGTCTASAVGEACTLNAAASLQSVCAAGSVCVYDGSCYDHDEEACGADPECKWLADYDGSFGCEEVVGECAVLPTSGDCLNAFYCGDGTYCDNDLECVAFSDEGEQCSISGNLRPLCAGCDGSGDCGALYCIAGACKYVCELDADCDDGEYCSWSGLYPKCAPRESGACDRDESCPSGDYCHFEGAICYAMETSADCAAPGLCDWYEEGFCDATLDCSGHADAETCNVASGCTFNTVETSCDAVADCDGFGTSSSCGENPECVWVQAYVACEPDYAGGECRALNEAGNECDPYQEGYDCTSGACSQNREGELLCEVELDTSGCSNNNATFLQFTFLFGAVWAIGRRRKR